MEYQEMGRNTSRFREKISFNDNNNVVFVNFRKIKKNIKMNKVNKVCQDFSLLALVLLNTKLFKP